MLPGGALIVALLTLFAQHWRPLAAAFVVAALMVPLVERPRSPRLAIATGCALSVVPAILFYYFFLVPH